MENELISRQAAIDALKKCRVIEVTPAYMLIDKAEMMTELKQLPSVQPEITDEQAIEHLQASGWMQNHDREIYESGLKERLADDSGDYDSLIPCEDTISRQAAIEIATQEGAYGYISAQELSELSSAQPEQRWIPCSERLPERPYGCLVTVWDTNPATIDEFENILPYLVGWDGEQWNDGDGEKCPFEVIAWIPLPEPYKEDKNG